MLLHSILFYLLLHAAEKSIFVFLNQKIMKINYTSTEVTKAAPNTSFAYYLVKNGDGLKNNGQWHIIRKVQQMNWN